MNEPAPLGDIQDCVLAFLCDREDAAVFGAQAVNAYVDVSRMTQDIDILATNAADLADAIKQLIADQFKIAIQIRSVAQGKGLRVYQVRKPKNRHLVDVRQVERLPPCQRVENVLVPQPPELISQKVISLSSRSNTAKGLTDNADLFRLLTTFPNLKTLTGPVATALQKQNASESAMTTWKQLVETEIEEDTDDY